MIRIQIVTIGLALAAVAAVAWPQAATTQGAVGIDKHIQAINEAQDPMAMSAAYARGLAIDAQNVQLNEALMRQALKLGYTELSYVPAVSLTRQGSQDGLAWGIVAQMQAKGGQYQAAFASIANAACLAGDDPFVFNRAAELMAWHDYVNGPPGLPSELSKQLDGVREQLAKNPAYQVAYESAKASLARGKTEKPLGSSVGSGNAPSGGRVTELTDEVARLRRTVEQLRRAECPPTYGQGRGTRQIAPAPAMSITSYSLYPFGPPAQAAAPAGLPPQNINPVDPRSANTPLTGGIYGSWIPAPIPFGGTIVVAPSSGGGGRE